MSTFPARHTDDNETLRLELLAALQQLSRERGCATECGEGYWLDSWGVDAALIRWIEGGTEDPPFAKIEFAHSRALVKPETSVEHPVVLDICENMGLDIYMVEGFAKPRCDECGGLGYRVAEYGYTVTGRGYGDAQPKEKIVDCTECQGQGVFR